MDTEQIIVFKLQEQEFGIKIDEVLEIQNYSTIRNMPGVPEYIAGIINVRGTVYPIINLHARLNLSACIDESESKFILLNLEGPHVGLMVDSVAEILTVEKTNIEQAPEITDQNKTSCVDGIVKQEGRIILILKTDVILSNIDEVVLNELEA